MAYPSSGVAFITAGCTVINFLARYIQQLASAFWMILAAYFFWSQIAPLSPIPGHSISRLQSRWPLWFFRQQMCALERNDILIVALRSTAGQPKPFPGVALLCTSTLFEPYVSYTWARQKGEPNEIMNRLLRTWLSFKKYYPLQSPTKKP